MGDAFCAEIPSDRYRRPPVKKQIPISNLTSLDSLFSFPNKSHQTMKARSFGWFVFTLFTSLTCWVVALAQVPPIGPTKTVCSLCGSTPCPHDSPGRKGGASGGSGPSFGNLFRNLGLISDSDTSTKNAAQTELRERRETASKRNLEGSTFLAKGEHENAVKSFREALNLNPDSEAIKANLLLAEGFLAGQQGDNSLGSKSIPFYERAVAAIQQALDAYNRIDPNGLQQSRDFRATLVAQIGLRQQALEKARAQAAQDADAAALMRQQLTSFSERLSRQNINAFADFDVAGREAKPRSELQFLENRSSAASNLVSPTHQSEYATQKLVHTDTSVVDLSDARTQVVHPGKVKGKSVLQSPPSQAHVTGTDSPSRFQRRQDLPKDLGAALLSENKNVRSGGLVKLAALSREQTETENEQLRQDVRILNANREYGFALEKVRARLKVKELDALEAANDRYHDQTSKYLDAVHRGRVVRSEEKENRIIDQLRRDQVAALRQYVKDYEVEVSKLKKRLIRDTGGKYVIPQAEN